MQFAYQARDISGKMRHGELAAASSQEATKLLRQEGMYLLSLDEASESTAAQAFQSLSLFQKRVSRSEIVYVTSQMAVMIDAGVPLSTALSSVTEQTENATLKDVLSRIANDVESGESFSAALNHFPKLFDKTYVNLVKASEASGTLGKMLERISVQSINEQEIRQKVRGALTYPAVMLCMCVGVCIFLLAYVFPKLTPMFASRTLEIPLPTRVMMSISNVLVHHSLWVVVGVAAFIGLIVYSIRQPWGRKLVDWIWLHVPVVGPMVRKVVIGRSLRTLATTINAGVPMLESLKLSASVSNNIYYEHCWLEVGDQVSTGRQIHEALEGNTLIPKTLVQMIASGESTGKLGQVLEKVSDYYEREVGNAIKSATSLIEPVMVLLMGGIIGGIALSMLLPIFRLSQSLN